jgi:hypothetical protein
MGIAPNIIMICIDIQWEDHQPDARSTHLKDTVATDALIGRLPIGARHSIWSKTESLGQ